MSRSSLWAEHCTVALAAKEQRCAGLLRLIHPGFGALGIAKANHGTDIDVGIAWITYFKRFDLIDKNIGEFFKDILLDQQALHRNAILPGVGEAAGGRLARRYRQIGVVVHDQTSITAQFQRDLLLPALLLSIQPTLPLPVKLIMAIRGSVTIISVSGPQAFNMLKACGG